MRSGHVFRAGFDVTVRQMMSSKRLCDCFDERGEERERERERVSRGQYQTHFGWSREKHMIG